jgi:hypothetical protein
MSTQVVEVSDGGIVVTTDVGLNGATKQSVADEATARANADIAHTAALALKAPLASPALTGIPTAPTAATGTSTTQLATTAFVQQELAAGGSTSRSLVVSVRNQSGGTMAAGTIVYLNGATGNLPTIAKALATSDATSAQTIGLVQTSIANNGTGLVVVRGILGNLNTSTLTEGQQLYLSPTTAGTYTTTKQYAPNHLVYVGIVTRAHPTQGSIEVAVQNGFEMDELHNVSAQSPTNGDTLRYNSATALWEKSALGTLATQNGTFSGTSSGTNTGDQTALTVASDFEMVLKNSVKIQSPEIEKVSGKRVNRWTHTEDITRATNLSASSVNAADFIMLNGIKLQRWTPIPGQGLYAFLSSRISAAYALLTAGKGYIISAYVVNVKGAATCGMANMGGTGFGHEQKYIDSQLRRIWTYGVAIDANRMDYGRTPTVAYGSAASVGDDQGVGYIAGCDYNVEADCYIGGIQVEEIPTQKMSIAMIGDSTMRGGFGSEVPPYYLNAGGDNYDARQVSRYLEWALNVPVMCRAVSGNTTAMMAARWASDITPLAHRSRYCVIQGGINDFGTGVSLATFQTNFTALRTLALADGMIPVMMTITPFGASGTMESNRLAANAWIRANFPLVIDAAEVVKDPFDSSKLRNESGWINDGTHYGDNAKRAIGFYAATLSFWDFPKPSAYEKVGTSYLPPNTYTVATLPAGAFGDNAYVTDATAPTYLGALTGGGAIKCKVFHNGTAWVSC